MHFLWCHWILLLLSYGISTSSLNLVCTNKFSRYANCSVSNNEDSNENENEHLRIEYTGKQAIDNLNKMDMFTNTEIPNSKFSSFLTEVFEEFPKLNYLYIHPSKIKFLSSDKLLPAKHLELLIFLGCEISEVQPHTFTSFHNITVLSLESNLLTHIQRDTFIDMPRLTTLNLKYNQIQTIEEGAFNLSKLTRLDISHNKLTTLSDSLFSSLHSLKVLFVNNNELTKIGRSMYSLPTIKQINLKYNQIVDIDLAEFGKLPLLSMLYLGNSGFSLESQTTSDFENANLRRLSLGDSISTDSQDLKKLSGFKELNYLDLRSESYTGLDLPSANIKSFLPKLEHIILQYHNVSCPNVRALYHKMREQGVQLNYNGLCLRKHGL